MGTYLGYYGMYDPLTSIVYEGVLKHMQHVCISKQNILDLIIG